VPFCSFKELQVDRTDSYALTYALVCGLSVFLDRFINITVSFWKGTYDSTAHYRIVAKEQTCSEEYLDHFEFHKVSYGTKLQDIFPSYLNNIWRDEHSFFLMRIS